MAKTPPARLGSNPFAESALPWIRDTRNGDQPSQPSQSPSPKDEPEAQVLAAAANEKPSAEPKKGAVKGKPAKKSGNANTIKQMNSVNALNHIKHEIRGATSNEVKTAPVIADRGAAAPAVEVPRKVGRPKSNHRVVTKSTQAGLPDGWTRATITIREDMLETLKRAAYWDRKTIKTVVDAALTTYLDGKTYAPIPQDEG